MNIKIKGKMALAEMEERKGRRSDGARTTHGACNNTTCMNMTMHMMIMRKKTDTITNAI